MFRSRSAVIAAALCAAAAAGTAAASTGAAGTTGTTGFYRQPTLQGEQVYLVAEGDLWRVGLQGGAALRLTTHPGLESQPAVSPDGRWLAFTGQYDGGTEIYLMPVAGGPPRRLTSDASITRSRPRRARMSTTRRTTKPKAAPATSATHGVLRAPVIDRNFG